MLLIGFVTKYSLILFTKKHTIDRADAHKSL